MQIINSNSPKSITLACETLSRGKLIVYPTETCYGLGVDPTSSLAISRLLAYKGDRQRQISVAVDGLKMAKEYVTLNSMSENLYRELLPGPLTVISQSRNILDPRLESATGTLGVRYPRHQFALALIKKFGRPITATSANTSGRKEPYSLADWQKYTSISKQKLVSLFLNAGKLLERPTSTIVDTTLNDPAILRQGQFVLPHFSPSYLSHSVTETHEIAQTILTKHLSLTPHFPLIIALQGDLGAGKTQFSKGLAHALNIADLVSSPTYTLMKEYLYQTSTSSGTFYHLDTWRLSDPTELESTLHFPKLLKPGNIIAIEWAGKAKNLLKTYEMKCPILVIDIKELDENTRRITTAFSTPEWS